MSHKLDKLKALRAAWSDDSPEAKELDSAIAFTESKERPAEERGAESGFVSPLVPKPRESLVAPEPTEPVEKQRVKNPKLPSASKSEEDYRDPEYVPDTGIGSGIPREFGGNLEAWDDPTIEDFRRKVGPFLIKRGIDPNQVDEGSDEFRSFADQEWVRVYDSAKATGKPVARLKYMNDPEWRKNASTAAKLTGSAIKGITQGTRGLVSGAYGYLEGRTIPGASTIVSDDMQRLREVIPGKPSQDTDTLGDEQRALREQYPVSNTVGTLLGAVDPRSLGSHIVAATGKRLAGSGLLTRAAGQGLVGATTGAVGSAIGDTVEQGSNIAAGHQNAYDAQQTADKAKISALLGGGLGTTGEFLAAGANAAREAILPSAERIPAEAGGFTFGFGGIKPPPNVKAAIGKAEGLGVSPESVLAEDIAPRVANASQDFYEAGQPVVRETVRYPSIKDQLPEGYRINGDKDMRSLRSDVAQNYMEWNRAERDNAARNMAAMLSQYSGKRATSRPMVQRASEILNALTDSDFRPTVPGPGIESGATAESPALARFKELESLGIWKTEWVPEHEAATVAAARNGIPIDPAKAEMAGMSAPGPGMKAVMLPRELTPRQVVALYRASQKRGIDVDPDTAHALSQTYKEFPGLVGFEEFKGNPPSATQWYDEARKLQTKEFRPLGGPRTRFSAEKANASASDVDKVTRLLSDAEANPDIETTILKEGMDPVEMARTLGFAKIPTGQNGDPIPWNSMDEGQQKTIINFLSGIRSGKIPKEVEALSGIAKAGGIDKDVEAFKGQLSGLLLMGKHKAPTVGVRVGPTGPRWAGIPRGAFVRLDPLLGFMGNKFAPAALAPGMGSDYYEEEKRQKRAK